MNHYLVVLLVSTLPFLSGCSGNAKSEDALQGTFQGVGVISTIASAEGGDLGTYGKNDQVTIGSECIAESGFQDIYNGSQVTVLNGKSEIVALGSVGKGRIKFIYEGKVVAQEDLVKPELLTEFVVKYSPKNVSCDFDVLIAEIPTNEEFYTVRIGDGSRGDLTYTKEDLIKGFSVSIGR